MYLLIIKKQQSKILTNQLKIKKITVKFAAYSSGDSVEKTEHQPRVTLHGGLE